MRAVVCPGAKEPLVLREIQIPKPKPNEILLRVRACGVCHTDLDLADGHGGAIKYPRVLGHEVTGEVSAVGSGVSKTMMGMRVGVSWTHSACGLCRNCLRGEEALCADALATGVNVDGGYAEFMTVPASSVVRLPLELDFAEAAPLICAGVTGYRALKSGGIRPACRVAVLGIGGLGHLAVQFARYMGAEVIAVTGTAEKEHLARELGAHYTINTRRKNLLTELKYLGGADLILSTVTDTKEVEKAFQGLAPDGTLVVIGALRGNIAVPAETLLAGRRHLAGVPAGSRHDLQEMLDLCSLHHVRPLIERLPLEKADEAHRRLRSNIPRFRDVLIVE